MNIITCVSLSACDFLLFSIWEFLFSLEDLCFSRSQHIPHTRITPHGISVYSDLTMYLCSFFAVFFLSAGSRCVTDRHPWGLIFLEDSSVFRFQTAPQEIPILVRKLFSSIIDVLSICSRCLRIFRVPLVRVLPFPIWEFLFSLQGLYVFLAHSTFQIHE